MRKPPSKAQLAWYASDRFRAIGSKQATKLLRARALLPRCGAYAKSTGKPCLQAAMPNGRCYVHGGKTPKGKDWHRVQWPDGSAPDAEKKLNRKLRALDKRACERKRRVVRMTPEERTAHKAWQAAHAPSSPAERARRRAKRKAAADARRLVKGLDEPKPVNAEQQALLDAIAAGEARLAILKFEAVGPTDYREGVFQ